MANTAYAYHTTGHVEELRAAARSLGFDLPIQAEREMLQSYRQPMPMHRFDQDTPIQAPREVSTPQWARLIERAQLAADIDEEYRAIRMRQVGM